VAKAQSTHPASAQFPLVCQPFGVVEQYERELAVNLLLLLLFLAVN
jgi:hypothetical protein